ncbi:MAG: NAD(P)H-hydrate epimerase [Candidatus Omnitrophica bacterium]|nr:NAD(P)H-hydrate epimerase [Candidatus Omnitrophota bacterium]
MMRPVTAGQMAEIDRRAQEEFAIPQERLMENAGKAAFDLLTRRYPRGGDGLFVVVCGKGNNGGDGLVLARYLAEAGAGDLIVYAPGEDVMKPGAAKNNLTKVKDAGLDVRGLERFNDDAPENAAVVIDALFGTGFKGSVRQPYLDICFRINALRADVYSLDVPSGLDSTTGDASEGCVRADVTITFGLTKTGFFRMDGPAHCGRITVADIGFPSELLDQYVHGNS